MSKITYLFFLQGSTAIKQLRDDGMRQKIMDRESERLLQMPRVPETCAILSMEDYNKFLNFQFYEPESGKRIYMGTTINPIRGNPQEPKNNLAFPAPPGTIVTRSNGYCDRGVYKSWNKCNVDGECYDSCTDGLCHEQHRNRLKTIDRTDGCRIWYFKCLEECDSDPKCKAFSFIAQNVLGHPEYTCNLMNALTCSYGSLNKADTRTSFHVKGAYMESLFAKYNAKSFKEFDYHLERDPEFKFNHWSAWGYHSCQHTPKPGCGVGTVKRRRMLANGRAENEGRPCEWKDDDGNSIACTDVVSKKKDGHGWMHWSNWSTCSKSCKVGYRTRFRACGSCANADENGLCSPDDLVGAESKIFYRKGLEHCPDGDEREGGKCVGGYCLPPTSGKWKRAFGKPFKIKTMWAPAPKTAWTQTIADIEGGCVDYENAYKKVNLDSISYGKFHDPKGTFGECMRICQMDEKSACLSVTFFPSDDDNMFYGTDEYGNERYNCFLHNRRCHEDAEFRNGEFLAANPTVDQTKSWYAYKDLCSAPKAAAFNTCQYLSTYYQTMCDSSGDRAFPNTNVCKCPMSGDKGSEFRVWGSTAGKAFYDESTGLVTKTRLSAKPYSIAKYNKIFLKYSLAKYESVMQDTNIGCHNPCQHNRCITNSKCVLNPEAQFGYDCICVAPLEADTSRFGEGLLPIGLAGYGENNGCVTADVRNVGPDYKDNFILYGGGWNQQLPIDGSSNRPKPHYQYYGLEATGSIYHYKVTPATQKIPAPSFDEHKGKFYNCMVNIAPNRVMVLGGRPGQSFNIWDDKTFVYEWGQNATNIADNGKWIGTDGNRMDDLPSACLGQAGCMRNFDWPDLPSQSVLNCQGQCRNGEAGRGPTVPKWINAYCHVNSKFYDGYNWSAKSFNLCQYHLVADENGVELDGREGKWSSAPNPTFNEQWNEYTMNLKKTIQFYRGASLIPADMDELDPKFIELNKNNVTVTNQSRWKNPLPSDMYHPIIGPASYKDITTIYQYPQELGAIMNPNIKEYIASGQPACGVMGDRVFIGSGKFARFASLSISNADKELWKIEPNSEFPHLYRKADGSECMITIEKDNSRDKFPNFRQNFGTVVTTQGLWMIGGLIAPSSDLPGGPLNIRYNQPGCTKHSHLNDVWAFNPRGWSIQDLFSNDAGLIAKYENSSASDIFPKRVGYPFGNDQNANTAQPLDQTFEDFRLSDSPGGNFNLTIDAALNEGWACTGISGKWCRKPFLPRHTKGTESLTMCFEMGSGTEEFGSKTIPRRPRVCSIDETDGTKDEKCICFIINVAGQSGPKQSPGGSGFRPEVDFLEIPRVDGTWGSDNPFYQDVEEYCPNAMETYPEYDTPIDHNSESAVGDFTECTTECGGEGQPECNRSWKKINLRRKWHEAGRIRHGRMGFLSGTLKGEIMIFGGECFGTIVTRSWNNDGSLRGSNIASQPHPCGMKVESFGKGTIDDYIEVFGLIRMNQAGYIFGGSRNVHLDGYQKGKATHDEASVSQAFSLFNANF